MRNFSLLCLERGKKWTINVARSYFVLRTERISISIRTNENRRLTEAAAKMKIEKTADCRWNIKIKKFTSWLQSFDGSSDWVVEALRCREWRHYWTLNWRNYQKKKNCEKICDKRTAEFWKHLKWIFKSKNRQENVCFSSTSEHLEFINTNKRIQWHQLVW